jgi:hypothetical protein
LGRSIAVDREFSSGWGHEHCVKKVRELAFQIYCAASQVRTADSDYLPTVVAGQIAVHAVILNCRSTVSSPTFIIQRIVRGHCSISAQDGVLATVLYEVFSCLCQTARNVNPAE